MTTLNIVADFMQDWASLMRAELTALGFNVNPSATSHELTMMFSSAQRRLAHPAKRTVHRAKELTCPAEHKAGLDALLQKVADGDDVRPHQSKKIRDAEYEDMLLNDWGVLHFHLGVTVGPDGFAQRTGPVLFARVTDSEFFAIDVMGHGSWSRQKVVEILHTNWPESIERYRLKGVIDIATVPTDDDIGAFRNAGLISFVKVGDAIYAPIGGGYATSGTSTTDVMNADRAVKWIRRAEQHVRDNFGEFVRVAATKGITLAGDVRVALVAGANGEMVAHCPDHGIAFGLGKGP